MRPVFPCSLAFAILLGGCDARTGTLHVAHCVYGNVRATPNAAECVQYEYAYTEIYRIVPESKSVLFVEIDSEIDRGVETASGAIRSVENAKSGVPGTFKQHSECIVIDKDNWSCSDGHHEQMAGGKYSNADSRDAAISRMSWWLWSFVGIQPSIDGRPVQMKHAATRVIDLSKELEEGKK